MEELFSVKNLILLNHVKLVGPLLLHLLDVLLVEGKAFNTDLVVALVLEVCAEDEVAHPRSAFASEGFPLFCCALTQL